MRSFSLFFTKDRIRRPLIKIDFSFKYIPRRLNRLRQKATFRGIAVNDIMQGLKPVVYFSNMRHG
jgi:hypothetical protein